MSEQLLKMFPPGSVVEIISCDDFPCLVGKKAIVCYHQDCQTKVKVSFDSQWQGYFKPEAIRSAEMNRWKAECVCYKCCGEQVFDEIVEDDNGCRICVMTCEEDVQEEYANLMAAAPDMRDCICDALSDLQMPEGMRRHFEEVLKQANGGKELPESKWKE